MFRRSRQEIQGCSERSILKDASENVDETESMREAEDIDSYLVGLELGEGAMRFSGPGERSIEDQLNSLTPSGRKCIAKLRRKWENDY